VTFLHDAPDFDELLQIVASRRSLSVVLVEKDYWVTHTLWALHQLGLEVWFKGGTSLSKGFGLIERFSEDLDLKVEPGSKSELPRVENWKSEGKAATAQRREYFEALRSSMGIAGATVMADPTFEDPTHRGAQFRVEYPSRHLATLHAAMKPFVLLEIGSARVTPFVLRDMTSFVHDEVAAQGLAAEFLDDRPMAVRCVHPIVTLLEKLDALQRKVHRADVEPALFVRHFEDAARIAQREGSLPALEGFRDARALAEEMLEQRQLARLPDSDDPAFRPDSGARFAEIERAHEATAPMFWGPRLGVERACVEIRAWIDKRLGK
jgi:hypothetical protein